MFQIDATPSPARATRTRRGRLWAGAAMASLVMVVLAGCGGGSDTATSADGSTSAGSGNTDMQAYQECLAENGVELPDMGNGGPPQGGEMPAGGEAPAAGELPEGGAPPNGGQGGMPGVDSEAFAAAQEACADLAPEGGFGGAMNGGGPNSEEFQAYTDCLTENGVELTQPDANAEGGQSPAGGAGGFADLDESDPGVAACADLRPDMSGGPGGQGAQSGDTTTTTAASS